MYTLTEEEYFELISSWNQDEIGLYEEKSDKLLEDELWKD